MSALFTLPSQIPLNAGEILPGAKLYFFQTGTTTPQATYQNDARTISHAHPVVADANGVFAPIYLDPTLPSYRVRLTTSTDVQLFQYDGVPSNQNVQQSIRLESANPNLLLYDTDGTSNQRKFRMRAAGNSLVFESLNDAETVSTVFFSIEGGANQRFVFGELSYKEDGSGNENPLITQASGSFTATLTGFTTTVTGTIQWWRNGSTYTLRAASAILGTSNDTSMTMTGVPVGLLAGSGTFRVPTTVVDNLLNLVGSATLTTSAIIFSAGNPLGNFTNSGTKGLSAGWTMVYATNSNAV